ncbi:MAG: hypothetical protein WC509_08385 [Candidatus Izemoplasmatales bacterium]
MKKALMAILFATLAMVVATERVEAYSPQYLPGGVNYLSADNFEQDSGYYNTIQLFLVKPNTTYCLSMASVYATSHAYEIIIETFLDDRIQLTSVYYHPEDFTPVPGEDWVSLVFSTSATASYMDIYFSDPTAVFDFHTAELFQLEEGSVFTGYEEYVDGTVADVNGPYFDGNPVVISNVDAPITSAEIRAGLTAYDAIDGDLTATIVELSNAYAGNESTLGEYAIDYRVADTSGNFTDFRVTVKVVDVTAPMFGGETDFLIPYPDVMSIATILSQITASDNYDGDLSAAIVLKTDGYTANAGVLGSYQVAFSVADASGNVTDHSVTVSVVDEESPIFTGPSVYTIGYDNGMTVADIRAALSVVDDYDDDLTAAITVDSDEYSAHIRQIGAYRVVFRAVDSSGNATLFDVVVNVVDQIGPVVYVDASIVRVYNGTVLTLTDFTNLLVRAGELPKADGYRVTLRYDSYTAHASVPGVYHLTLDIVDPLGRTSVKTLEVVVAENAPAYVPGPDSGGLGEAFDWGDAVVWIVGGICFAALLATNIIWGFKVKMR